MIWSQKPGRLSNFPRRLFDRCFSRSGIASICVLCGAAASARGLCAGCWTELPWLRGPQCARCAHPLPVPGICGRCIAEPPHYDAVVAACRYAYPAGELIQACKFGGHLAAATPLAAMLETVVSQRPDVLVPMPLSAERLRTRGFNQALELARVLARPLGVPVDSRLCVKTRETPPQSRLPWKERRKNVRGAFVVQAALDGRHVAVVDDVLTTGATLDELARNLKRAGAATVTGFVVARTVAGAMPDQAPLSSLNAT